MLMAQLPRVTLESRREEIRRVFAAHRLHNPRVFGSVARGEDTESSDIDFLVDITEQTTGFDLGGAYVELSALVQVGIDLITSTQLPKAAREQILAEAVPV
jgi:predicted nucleotidyltransferase